MNKCFNFEIVYYVLLVFHRFSSGQPIFNLGNQIVNLRGPAGYHNVLVKFNPCVCYKMDTNQITSYQQKNALFVDCLDGPSEPVR
jgi:hypothetical protein